MSKVLNLFGKSKMKGWETISTIEDLDKIQAASFSKPQIIFKHSTRCSISSMAKNRMEEGLTQLQTMADIHYLDLLSFRNISNEIEYRFKVEHESPQVIILKNGVNVYNESHHMIKVDEIAKQLETGPKEM